jgi:hypothetical protein
MDFTTSKTTFKRLRLVISVDTNELLLRDEERCQLWTRNQRQNVALQRSDKVTSIFKFESLEESVRVSKAWGELAKAVEEAYDVQAASDK